MPQAGTYTALQKLKPITTDFGKIAKDEELLQFKYREEENAKKALRKAERDAISYDIQAPIVTGIDNLDQGLTLGLQEVADGQHEDFIKARSNPEFADSSEYKIRSQNRDKYSENLKAFTDGITELAGKLITKANDGTMSQWDDGLLGTMNGAYTLEKVKFGEDKYGKPVAFVAVADLEEEDGLAKDEDGKPILKKVTPADVFKGLGQYSITGDVDVAGAGREIGTELGKDFTESVNGYSVTKEQNWEDKKEDVKEMSKGLLGTSKNPTALSKRLWADIMGESSRQLTDSDMGKIEDEFLKQVKPYYDEFVEKDPNFSAMESAASRRDKKSKEEDIEGAFNIRTNDSTGEPVKTFIDGASDKGQYGYSFTLPKKATVGLKEERFEIDNLFLTDSGYLAFGGKRLEGTESSTEDGQSVLSEGSKMSAKKINIIESGVMGNDQIRDKYGFDLNDVAVQYGFSNSVELKKHLTEVRDGFLNTNKKEDTPKTKTQPVKTKSGNTYN
jgi:hypothetical protein